MWAPRAAPARARLLPAGLRSRPEQGPGRPSQARARSPPVVARGSLPPGEASQTALGLTLQPNCGQAAGTQGRAPQGTSRSCRSRPQALPSGPAAAPSREDASAVLRGVGGAARVRTEAAWLRTRERSRAPSSTAPPRLGQRCAGSEGPRGPLPCGHGWNSPDWEGVLRRGGLQAGRADFHPHLYRGCGAPRGVSGALKT